MDFIANATGSIFAQGWTPSCRNWSAASRRRGSTQGRPGGVPEGAQPVDDAADGPRRGNLHASSVRGLPIGGSGTADSLAKDPPVTLSAGSSSCQPWPSTASSSSNRWSSPSSTRSTAGMASARRRGSDWRTTWRSSATEAAQDALQRLQARHLLQPHPGDPRAGGSHVIHRVASGRFGTVSRTVLFLPQVIPLVAAGIIWGRLLSLNGLINQVLTAIGLGDITRAWLGDFDFALPAVGLIGIWVLLGFCTVLLLTGMTRIDPRAVRVGPDRRRGLVPGIPQRSPCRASGTRSACASRSR